MQAFEMVQGLPTMFAKVQGFQLFLKKHNSSFASCSTSLELKGLEELKELKELKPNVIDPSNSPKGERDVRCLFRAKSPSAWAGRVSAFNS